MSRVIEKQPENLKCDLCTGSKCCTYITEAIDTPRSKADFGQLLWQVSHEGVEVYKDGSGWYLLIQGQCSHLLADGRCRIYASRPQICRDYDTGWCEYDAPAEDGFLLHFKGYEELLQYCQRRFRRWGQ